MPGTTGLDGSYALTLPRRLLKQAWVRARLPGWPLWIRQLARPAHDLRRHPDRQTQVLIGHASLDAIDSYLHARRRTRRRRRMYRRVRSPDEVPDPGRLRCDMDLFCQLPGACGACIRARPFAAAASKPCPKRCARYKSRPRSLSSRRRSDIGLARHQPVHRSRSATAPLS